MLHVVVDLFNALQIQPGLDELPNDVGDDDTQLFVGKLNFTVEYGLSTGLV